MIPCLLSLLVLFGVESTRVLDSLEETQGGQYWIVLPKAWVKEIQPLTQFRVSSGLTVCIAPLELFQKENGETQWRIREFFRNGFQTWKQKPEYLLLIGEPKPESIPVFYKDWSREDMGPESGINPKELKSVPSDLPYSQMDEDELPDLALGRISARSAEELKGIVAKILDYEKFAPGLWKRRIILLAGLFGEPRIDAVIQKAVTGMVDQEVPYDFDFHVIEASPNFPNETQYGVGFDRTREFFQLEMQRGALIGIYAGHGEPSKFVCPVPPEQADGVSKLVKRKWVDLFTTSDAAQQDCSAKPPIFLSFACFTGGFGVKKETIAEAAIRNPKGPVAFIGASGISNPISDLQLAHYFTRFVTENRQARLGNLLRDGKRKLLEGQGEFAQKAKTAAMLFGYSEEVVQNLSRFENWIYTLHGDPALLLQKPQSTVTLSVSLPEKGRVHVRGEVPGFSDGEVYLTLETIRSRLVDWKKAENESELGNSWFRANDKVIAKQGLELKSGSFEASFARPNGMGPGHYFIKAYVQTENADAFGSVRFELR